MDFKEIYKPPFKVTDDGLFIKASNNVKAFTVAAKNPEEEANNIVSILNDDKGEIEKYDSILLFGGNKIITSHASVLVTRGFGELIGNAKLSVEEACKTQDDFIDWVVKKLEK